VAAGCGTWPVAGDLEEVDRVQDRQGTRQVCQEDEAAFERRDEERFAAAVVCGDLGPELLDPRLDLARRQVDLADPGIVLYEARSSW
jgi:hypothetical protein